MEEGQKIRLLSRLAGF